MVTVWFATIIVVLGAVFSAATGATLIAIRNRLGDWLGRRYALAQGYGLDLPTTASLIVTPQRVLGLIGLIAILVGIAILCIGLAALYIL